MNWEDQLAALAQDNPDFAAFIQKAINGDEAAAEQLSRAYQQGELSAEAKALIDEGVAAGAITLPEVRARLPQRPVGPGGVPVTAENKMRLTGSLREDPYGYLASHDYGGAVSAPGSGLPDTRIGNNPGDTARTFAEPGMAEWEYTRRGIPKEDWPPEVETPGISISPLADTETRRLAQREATAADIEKSNKTAEFYGDPLSEPGSIREELPPEEALPGFRGPGSTYSGTPVLDMSYDERKRYYAEKLRATLKQFPGRNQ